MDISIRDKLLDDLQIELQHKKRFLKNKYIDIKKTSDDNIFLEDNSSPRTVPTKFTIAPALLILNLFENVILLPAVPLAAVSNWNPL